MQLHRRDLLAVFLGAPVWSLVGTGPSGAQEAGPRLEPTPACGDDAGATPPQTEGPFYRPDEPVRHRLVAPGASGERITIAGLVMDTACRPMKGAAVGIWHADEEGDYAIDGERFRGVHRSDADGRWWFSTIVPALYPGRTRHYHFKVGSPGRRPLTTQLYFPGDPLNARDSLFDERLVLHVTQTADGQFGRYDFVV